MKREIAETLEKRLFEDRAIALLGPRQSGKSYLLRQISKEDGAVYLNLDDPQLREEIQQDPLAYLKRRYVIDKPLFIDEAAKVPALFDAIKILIDDKGSAPSKICLANSGNYLLMNRVKESLAGRVSLLSLYPLSWREFCNGDNLPGLSFLIEKQALPQSLPDFSSTETNRLRNERLLLGGYPTPALHENQEQQTRWAADYFKTYIFPLLLDQFNLRSIESFEKCARLLFIQSAQTLNFNRLARESGISQPTAVSYVHQLKAMMLIVVLEPYYRNNHKRLTKQPKVHVVDPLLLHQSLGTNFNLQTAKERGVFGAIYESFIAIELIKTLENMGKPYQMFCWRTADKAEVDLILEVAGQTIPIEIKSSQTITNQDASGLRSFLEDNANVKNGYIVYPGNRFQKITENIFAIPDWWLLGAW